MFSETLKDKYNLLFGQPWEPWIGGLLLGFLNVFIFAYAEAWTTLLGIIHWGQNVLKMFGFLEGQDVFPIIISHNSVLNLSLLLGAMIAALLANEFGFRMAPPLELVKAVIGGSLMGIGANLAQGCNIGGFFSAVSALSLGGFAMMFGLLIGAYLGIRYLLWESEKIPPKLLTGASKSGKKDKKRSKSFQPLVGFSLLVAAVGLAFLYDFLDYTKVGVFLLFGLLLGVVNQRSRFCFVRALREPFLTGDGKMTRAVILGTVVGIIGFTIIKWASLDSMEDRLADGVRATFWMGGLLGGFIFGFGMSLLGGCASGALWRAGEGHLKLWLGLFAFAIVGAAFNSYLINSGLMQQLGEAVFLPEWISWKAALILVLGFMGLWSLGVSWNEVKRKFTLI